MLNFHYTSKPNAAALFILRLTYSMPTLGEGEPTTTTQAVLGTMNGTWILDKHVSVFGDVYESLIKRSSVFFLLYCIVYCIVLYSLATTFISTSRRVLLTVATHHFIKNEDYPIEYEPSDPHCRLTK